MPTLIAVETFVRVAELGSFTKAADELDVSRTMASKHVMDLEAELGAKLLNRTTRTVHLTEAGEHYLDRARDALDRLNAAGDAVGEFTGAPKGRLRVTAPLSFGTRHVAPALVTFHERFPDVSVDIDLVDRTVDLMAEGYDVALRIGALADSSLIARRLAPIRRVLCASPDYLARAGTPRNPADLAEHQCLGYSLMAERADWRLDGLGGTESVTVAGCLRANNGDVLADLAVAGHGIINSPTFIVAEHLADGRLVRVLPEHAPPAIALHAVYPPDRRPPLKLRGFIDHMAETFGGVPPWDRVASSDGLDH